MHGIISYLNIFFILQYYSIYIYSLNYNLFNKVDEEN